MDYLEANELLDEVESSAEYESYEMNMRNALDEQWYDLVYSGLVIMLLNKLFSGEEISVPKSPLGLIKLRKVITQQTEKNIISLGKYQEIKIKTRIYLELLANIGGGFEMNRFIPGVSFKLTNKFYRKKIQGRVDSLLKGMDKYTIKRFTSELVKAMATSKTKKQVITRLNKAGRDIAKARAINVMKSETSSALEYMRLQVAMMNGIQYKQWKTTLDERTCPICRPLHNQVTEVGMSFPGGYNHPVVHAHCRCTLLYIWKMKEFDISKAYEFYGNVDTGLLNLPRPNKDYYWAGGNKYKGKDVEDINTFYEILSQYTEEEIRLHFGKKTGVEYLYFSLSKHVDSARDQLTDVSFNILMYKLANRGKTPGQPFLIPKI